MRDEPQPAPAGPGTAAEALIIRPLRGDRGLALEGEADANSRQALRKALHGMASHGQRELHLELAGLRFIDVSCTREIIQVIDCLRLARVQVRLHHPPRALCRIAGCLNPDQDEMPA
jgi:anti-anti-sigma regulatory factor